MNKLMTILAGLVIIVGLVFLVGPAGHIPLLDANRAILAETEAAGYCAGESYVETRGAGSDLTECISESTYLNTINYQAVQPAFCRALFVKAGYPQDDCMSIMTTMKLWPTIIGGLTNSWNRRFPYPGDMLSANQPTTGGRTGERTDNERDGLSR